MWLTFGFHVVVFSHATQTGTMNLQWKTPDPNKVVTIDLDGFLDDDEAQAVSVSDVIGIVAYLLPVLVGCVMSDAVHRLLNALSVSSVQLFQSN